MMVTRFDALLDLIIVAARVWGPRTDRQLLLALDTAATHTHLTPDILDYEIRSAEGRILAERVKT